MKGYGREGNDKGERRIGFRSGRVKMQDKG